MADPDLHPIVMQCIQVLSSRPAGLLTDIDGTVSFIAPTPDAATVSESARDALRKLVQHLDVVGTISGRAAENSESMVGLPDLLYIGNHGLERRTIGLTTINPMAELAVQSISDVLAEVRARTLDVPIFEGVIFENKVVTASVHYRLASDQAATREALLALIEPETSARGLRVTEGRMVIELRPSISVNKGTAVTSVVEEHGLKGLVFLGDDITDIDAFASVVRLRAAGVLAGVNVAVVSAESLPEVARAADVIVHGVEACVTLLTAIAAELSRIGETE